VAHKVGFAIPRQFVRHFLTRFGRAVDGDIGQAREVHGGKVDDVILIIPLGGNGTGEALAWQAKRARAGVLMLRPSRVTVQPPGICSAAASL
jgi:hypothetical protein